MTVELGLEEIVLRTALYGLHRKRFVARVADDQDGDVGCGPPELVEGLESLAIRQEQIEQHSVYLSRVQSLDARGEVRDPFDREGSIVCLRTAGSNRFGVGRISLDQQYPLGALMRTIIFRSSALCCTELDNVFIVPVRVLGDH